MVCLGSNAVNSQSGFAMKLHPARTPGHEYIDTSRSGKHAQALQVRIGRGTARLRFQNARPFARWTLP